MSDCMKFTQKTDAHGICHIPQVKSTLFVVIWIVCSAVSFCFLVLLTIGTVQIYRSVPIGTVVDKISVDFCSYAVKSLSAKIKVIQRNEIMMPNLILCSGTRYDFKRIKETFGNLNFTGRITKESGDVFQGGFGLAPYPVTQADPFDADLVALRNAQAFDLYFLRTWIMQQQQQAEANRRDLEGGLSDPAVAALPHGAFSLLPGMNSRCEDLVLSCTRSGGQPVDCCGKAVPLDLYQVPGCWSFELPNQSSPGIAGGVQILYRAPSAARRVLSGTFPPTDGLMLSLATPSHASDPYLSVGPLTLVPLASHSALKINAAQYMLISKPDDGATKSLETCARMSEKQEANPNYRSRERCDFDCMTAAIRTHCGCQIPYNVFDYPATLRQAIASYNMSVCNTGELMLNCTFVRASGFFADSSECRRRCLPPCEYVSISSSTTTGRLSPAFLRHLNVSWEGQEERMVVLDVYYDELVYTKVQQYFAMTGNAFISDTGGMAGLYTGSSWLTMGHVGIFVVQRLFGRLRRVSRDLVFTRFLQQFAK